MHESVGSSRHYFCAGQAIAEYKGGLLISKASSHPWNAVRELDEPVRNHFSFAAERPGCRLQSTYLYGDLGAAFRRSPHARFLPCLQVVAMQWADNGPGWISVMLADADAVLAVRPRRTGDLKLGLVGFFPPGSEHAYVPSGPARSVVPSSGKRTCRHAVDSSASVRCGRR